MKADVKGFQVKSLFDINAVLGCSSNGTLFAVQVDNGLLNQGEDNCPVDRRRGVYLKIHGRLLVLGRRFAQSIDHSLHGRTGLRLVLKAG